MCLRTFLYKINFYVKLFLILCVLLASSFFILCVYWHIYNTCYVDCNDIIIRCPLQIGLTWSLYIPCHSVPATIRTGSAGLESRFSSLKPSKPVNFSNNFSRFLKFSHSFFGNFRKIVSKFPQNFFMYLTFTFL